MTARGYTLIEGVFALLLVAILSRLAWSGYEASIRRTHRTLAQARLVEAALWMEQHRAIHQRYADPQGGVPQLPPELQEVQAQGRVRYAIQVELPQPWGTGSRPCRRAGVMPNAARWGSTTWGSVRLRARWRQHDAGGSEGAVSDALRRRES